MRVRRALAVAGTISACLAVAGTAQAAPQDGPLPVVTSALFGPSPFQGQGLFNQTSPFHGQGIFGQTSPILGGHL
ncbi:hypothetical protein ACFWJT_23230 [Streptomyces sp. NPDC127069]|uniref:hypothetical protein n=1 Tax=Streptomyces sp. NPDC127069 TaxID=3347128 RepID=UPI00364FFA6C